MPKPTAVNTTNADAGGDNPQVWRADALDLTGKFNAFLAQITEFMWALLSSADETAARAALGVSARGSFATQVYQFFSSTTGVSANNVRRALTVTTVSINVGGGGGGAGPIFIVSRSGLVRASVEYWSWLNASGTVSWVRLDLLVNGTATTFSAQQNSANVDGSVFKLVSVSEGQQVEIRILAFGGGGCDVILGGVTFEMLD